MFKYYTAAPDSVLFNADLVASYNFMLDADCDEDCDLNCLIMVSDSSRQEVYDKFHALPDMRIAQNLYLCACIEVKQRTVDMEDHIIEQTTEFWLGDQIKIKVCKTFFAHTFGLPNVRLDSLLDRETFEWFSMHKSMSTTDGYEEQSVHQHVESCSDFVLNSR